MQRRQSRRSSDEGGVGAALEQGGDNRDVGLEYLLSYFSLALLFSVVKSLNSKISICCTNLSILAHLLRGFINPITHLVNGQLQRGESVGGRV